MRDQWRDATLGEVATIRGSKGDPSLVDPATPYVGLEHLEGGNPRIPSVGRAGDVSSLVSRFEPGDTLFGRLRPYLKKVALADRFGVCTQEILVLQPANGVVLPQYLHLLASADSTIRWCVDKSAGSRMPRTSAADLLAVPVRVPPLAVQRRVVDFVETLTSVTVASAAVCVQSAGAARQLFEGGLADIPSLKTVALGEVCEVVGGKRLPKGTPWSPIPTAHPYIRATDIGDGGIKVEDLVYVPGDVWKKIARYVVAANDVLITIAGTVGSVGRVPESLAGANLTENAARLRADAPSLDSGYLTHWLRSDDAQAQILSRTVGTTQKKLALFRIQTLEIPLPSLADQKRIAELVTSAQCVAHAAERVTSALDQLRATLVRELLSGSLALGSAYDAFLESVA